MSVMSINTAVPILPKVHRESQIPTAIPLISEDQLSVLLPRIKPVRHENGKLFWLDTKPFHPRMQTFVGARIDDLVLYLRELDCIFTLHVYGNPNSFQPAESEALAFLVHGISPAVLDTIVAYEVNWIPDWKEISGLHLSRTALFVPEPWRRVKLFIHRCCSFLPGRRAW